MNNSIKRIKNLLVKFFSIVFVAGLMASCASVADSGFAEEETEKTTVSSDIPETDITAGGDEMDPIITPPPTDQGR